MYPQACPSYAFLYLNTNSRSPRDHSFFVCFCLFKRPRINMENKITPSMAVQMYIFKFWCSCFRRFGRIKILRKPYPVTPFCKEPALGTGAHVAVLDVIWPQLHVTFLIIDNVPKVTDTLHISSPLPHSTRHWTLWQKGGCIRTLCKDCSGLSGS